VIVIGADENGLGPILGPLVTTAVSLEVEAYGRVKLLRVGRALGVDDSKNTAGFGKMATAESLALAVAAAALGDRVPRDADELLAAIGLEEHAVLQRSCPASTRPQCWEAEIALPCFGGDLASGQQMLAGLARRGVRLLRVRSALACTRRLNDALAVGVSRVELDLHMMERLVLDARHALGGEVDAVCGMVGGIRDYPGRMRHLAAHEMTVLPARRGDLSYEFPGVGRVAFEIDADARHLPVALASMVGKYVRELWMERQNRFYKGHDDTLEPVSGYHDPVTRRFVAASTLLRKRIGIDPECFARASAKELKDRTQLALFE
jgi:ribonuclease HII